MRRHKDPTRKTTEAQKTPATPTAPTTATSTGALHPMRGAAPVMWRCTRYVALHPIRGAAPVMWHCTRYVAVHPNRRGALPTDRVQCPNKQEQTRNWHTEPLTATPLHAHLDPTGGRMGTAPTPPPALRPTPAHSDTSYTPLHAKSPLTCAQVGPERHLTGRRRDLWERTRPPMPQHLELPPPTCSV